LAYLDAHIVGGGGVSESVSHWFKDKIFFIHSFVQSNKRIKNAFFVAYFSLLKNLVKHDRFSDFLASARNFFTVPAFHCYFLALRKKGETKFCWKLRSLGIGFCATLQKIGMFISLGVVVLHQLFLLQAL